MLRRGDRDAAVGTLRASLASLGLLPAATDEPAVDPLIFDAAVDAAVRAFQQQRGLITDGIVGPSTERELVAARWTLGERTLTYTLSAQTAGDDVLELQTRLCDLGYDAGRADGLFTAQLDRAVREFQHHRGLTPDGVFGPATLRELQRIAPMASGGRPQYLREIEILRQAGPRLGGKRIVIDPAHGGDDPGWVVDGIRAADLTLDIAGRLAARMTATGMQAYVTRGAHRNPSAVERAKFANDVAADLVLSLHVDGSTRRMRPGSPRSTSAPTPATSPPWARHLPAWCSATGGADRHDRLPGAPPPVGDPAPHADAGRAGGDRLPHQPHRPRKTRRRRVPRSCRRGAAGRGEAALSGRPRRQADGNFLVP